MLKKVVIKFLKIFTNKKRCLILDWNTNMKISVIIPVHNEEKNIPFVYQELKKVLEELLINKKIDYEIIFINDGSTDNSLEVLKSLKGRDKKLRILNMDRNRGQAAALTAGFFHAQGDILITMDGDGQNDPKYIPIILSKLEEGYQVVTGFRQKRQEPYLTRILPSKIANRMIAFFTGVKLRDNGCSLKGYKRGIPQRWQIPHGFHRFIPALFRVKNEEVCEIPIIDRPRLYGKTHYNLKRTFEVLRELFTIPFILRNPIKYEKIWEKFFELSFLGFIIFILFLCFDFLKITLMHFGIVLCLTSFSFLSYVIWQNLKRFNIAQKEGVFKVEEIF